MPRGQIAQAFQKAVGGRHDAHIARNRLYYDAGDFVGERGEMRLYGGQVVELGQQGVLRERFGYAGAVGDAVRQRARTRRDQQRVGVAVIAALKLDYLGARGVCPRQPQRAHSRLSAGADEPCHINGIVGVGYHLGDGVFALGGRAETRSVRRRIAYRGDNLRVGVSEYQGAPGADVVNVFVAVGVPDPAARAARQEQRFAAYRAPRAGGAVHSARYAPFGGGVELCGALSVQCHTSLADVRVAILLPLGCV